MKKLTALLLTLVLALGIPATAFAAGTQTTTLTVTIPGPSYTLEVPADMNLTYGETGYQDIGTVKVTDVELYDRVNIYAKYTDLVNTTDPEDTIVLKLYDKNRLDKGWSQDNSLIKKAGTYDAGNSLMNLYGYPEGTYNNTKLAVEVPDWSGATPGATYESVITFVPDLRTD